MSRLKNRLIPRYVSLSTPYFSSDQRGWAWSLLGLLIVLLLTNTAANVFFVRQAGEMTSALAAKDSDRFWKAIYYTGILIAIAVPIYGLYYFVRDRLAIHWRTWMTKNYLRTYFTNRAYYKLLYSQSIDNPDQRISEDINSFTTKSLYFLLIFIEMGLQMFAFCGVLWFISKSLVVVLIAYAVIGTLVTWLVFGRPLVGLNFFLLRREGDFRYGLMRIRENAESIAFYGGEEQETLYLDGQFKEVQTTYHRLINWQFFLNVFQYTFSTAMIVIPGMVLAPRVLSGELEPGAVTEATGAFTAVFTALSVVVNKFDILSNFAAGVGRLDRFSKAIANAGQAEEDKRLDHAIDTVESDEIELDDVELQTPDGSRTLIKGLSLAIESGDGLLIVGASGCGKSSLLRAIAGLWNAGSGTIHRPALSEMLFLPQRPYLVIGSLRDQLLYPTYRDGVSDDELLKALEFVNLPHVVENCGGLDISADWGKVLSLGEQQRLAIARVLLAERPFVILDEATSALDEKNEARVYKTIKKSGATIVSISHRPRVAKFHTDVLVLKGKGKWELMPSEKYLASLQPEDLLSESAP
jgi:putative ATP-binding cassette transporter